eukprot:scaffold85204_cov21-Phaeocystis_antarctica.AAC.1
MRTPTEQRPSQLNFARVSMSSARRSGAVARWRSIQRTPRARLSCPGVSARRRPATTRAPGVRSGAERGWRAAGKGRGERREKGVESGGKR